ncbi:MAG: type II secretion system protein GspG [Myxococcota bacterium]
MNVTRKYRALRRRRTEGMTLVEIMIVVIIMALIATAVGIAVIPRWRKAQVDTARTDAQSIRSAVQLYLMDNNDCPSSAEDLQEGGYLDRSKRATDPWDEPFQIECEGDEIYVLSSGPDKQWNTEDDVE